MSPGAEFVAPKGPGYTVHYSIEPIGGIEAYRTLGAVFALLAGGS
jgi:hypothetical protein